jgi:hypothetical protein
LKESGIVTDFPLSENQLAEVIAVPYLIPKRGIGIKKLISEHRFRPFAHAPLHDFIL